MPFAPLYKINKDLIYNFLAKSYIEALKTSQIKKKDRPIIAKKILTTVESATTWEELLDNLSGIDKHFSIFDSALLKVKEENFKQKESSVIAQIKSYIKDIK